MCHSEWVAAKTNYAAKSTNHAKAAHTGGFLCYYSKESRCRRGEMSRGRYLTELLTAFNEEGFDLTLKELDMLLLLRKKTDQLLLETENRRETDVHGEE